jgi:lysophospholipase L1-like esterase
MKIPLGFLSGVILFSSVFSASAQAPVATPKPPRTPDSAVTPGRENLRRHAAFMDRIKAGPVGLLFLGDSITDGWSKAGEYTFLKFTPYNPANFGISGETTEQVLWRITNGELEGIDPKAVVIMIGTNNIGQFRDEKPEWAAAGIRKIVDTVKEKLPNTKILLLGVFPRNEKASDNRQDIEAINKIISGYADGKTVTYLDIGDKFLDANGEIPADIMPDKLHPNARGYAIWYDAMMPTLQGLLK